MLLLLLLLLIYALASGSARHFDHDLAYAPRRGFGINTWGSLGKKGKPRNGKNGEAWITWGGGGVGEGNVVVKHISSCTMGNTCGIETSPPLIFTIHLVRGILDRGRLGKIWMVMMRKKVRMMVYDIDDVDVRDYKGSYTADGDETQVTKARRRR